MLVRHCDWLDAIYPVSSLLLKHAKLTQQLGAVPHSLYIDNSVSEIHL